MVVVGRSQVGHTGMAGESSGGCHLHLTVFCLKCPCKGQNNRVAGTQATVLHHGKKEGGWQCVQSSQACHLSTKGNAWEQQAVKGKGNAWEG